MESVNSPQRNSADFGVLGFPSFPPRVRERFRVLLPFPPWKKMNWRRNSPLFPREIIECPLSRRGRTEDSFWISICPYQLPPVIRTNRFTTRIVRCFGIEMINDSVYDFKLNVSRNVLRYDVKKTTFSPKSFVTRYTSPRTVAISCATCHPSPNRPHLPSPRFEQQS